ncbi:MAG TPA: sigma-54-dependent Fis family transcriptional regulator [Bacillota bacterium]|nr:sigma-54-dependent Fis family transcriptional regulator [Bacillota bacterium]HPW40376.1 sigma-54-dependent Fis family transcriptional regulator [Bacillota bacterium]HPX68643.1 sigma-54-dependent Fis family transcriptional regulator [Bacillota bacterium]HQA64884.1 sigma-54-dependent Fis family transcriptional regulator [Bacillota bacterium]
MKKDIELILNSTHDAMIGVDTDGIITLFNKAAERLTGIEAKDAMGKYVADVIKDTRLPYILETGESELNRQQDLGNIKIITNRMPVKDKKGRIIGAVAVFRDITEIIKLAEEITNLNEVYSLLEAIINATQDAISVVDQNGLGVMINPAYIKITGLSEKDVIGKPATVDIAEGESIHMQVLKTRKPIKGALMKVGPARKEVLVNAAPIIVNGELRGSVGVIHDMSEITKLSNELKNAKNIIRSLEAKYTFEDIIGSDPLLLSAIDKAKKAAEIPITVLLRGESGTGKEIFAHAIHNESERKFRKFIKVNCSAIPETLLESELFGYEEGAFTGAKKGGKKGLFEEAEGGTIFLDEIGEIPHSTQTKLLRVLQEKEIVRVGGTKSISIDVRIIAATNVDLEVAIESGRFRADLYYRLNVLPITIPPLRLRKGDIYDLSIFFIKKFNQQYGRNVRDITQQAVSRLKEYNWPGNVRELDNFIGRAIINMKASDTVIQENHLPKLEGFLDAGDNPDARMKGRGSISMTLDSVVEKAEKEHIAKVMKECGNNKTKAAKNLNISLRSLYYKLERYGLE